MTTKEAAYVLAILRAAFPSFYKSQTDADIKSSTRLWAEMFADDDPGEVSAAVKDLIATRTSSFPPVIGEVKAKLGEIRQPNRMQAQEAWALAAKAAAGNLSWDKLPPLVQKAIGSRSILRDWGMIDTERFNSVIYSQFLKAYGTYDTREKERAALPSDIRTMIEGVAERLAIGDAKPEIKRLEDK